MSIYNAANGTTLKVVEFFVDDFGVPLVVDEECGVPELTLYDENNEMVSCTQALPGSMAGEWVADLPIPKMDIKVEQTLRCIWKFVSNTRETIKITNIINVAPSSNNRRDVSVGLFGTSDTFSFYYPAPLTTADAVLFALYDKNVNLYVLGIADEKVKLSVRGSVTKITLPLTVPRASLVSYTCTTIVDGVIDACKVWAITPQIMQGIVCIEEFLNKAHIEDTITELQYTKADLLGYLERGLNMFNMLPPLPTSFNGTNMQGHLFDAWIVCSCYFALGAQLQAEGMLSFDFSGQTVNLSVDRTGQLDSALGRIETEINDRVKPYKTLLVKSGSTSGDGSIGSKSLSFGAALGKTTLINAPTTRILRPDGRFRQWY